MQTTRRQFLKYASLLFIASLLPIGLNGWAASLSQIIPTGADAKRKRLIVLFQRGAVDGLNVVIPHGDSTYYDARPTIAIRSSGTDGVIDLDGFFGLHPALSPLLPLWREKSLAFIHAAGSPDPSRSHFDAQKFMESGTPGVLTTQDGWMNRLLSLLPGSQSPTRAISVGPILPFILHGKMSVANLPLGNNSQKPMPLDRPIIENAFDKLYDGNDPLSQAYKEGRIARKTLLSDLEREMVAANNGAPLPQGFPESAEKLGALLADDPNIQLAFIDVGGWDTHINQGAATGQLANHLKPFGDGIARLVKRLGPVYDQTIIMVLSEFGRTIHENGNGGTDHGHGNVLWLLGGGVHGGKIFGEWPGLSTNLFEGRDLAVTTDFRNVVNSVLANNFYLDENQLGTIFPTMDTIQPLNGLFI